MNFEFRIFELVSSLSPGAHQRQGSGRDRRHPLKSGKPRGRRCRTRRRPQTPWSSSVLPDQPARDEHLFRLQQPDLRGHPQSQGPDQVARRVQRGRGRPHCRGWLGDGLR